MRVEGGRRSWACGGTAKPRRETTSEIIGWMTPETISATALPPVPLTVDGASVLHQMMRVRWPAWRALSASERDAILAEASAALGGMEAAAEGRQSAIFSLLGHKGDLLLVHFRRS